MYTYMYILLLLLLLLLLLRRSARAGGKNCQTHSPWAERKGAVGRRNAGQAGTDDDRGGGGGVSGEGGVCARGGGRGHLWVSPWSPPPAAGERVARPVRSGGAGGGGGAGQGPCGGKGMPRSAVTPRLARPSRQGGRSSCVAAVRQRALARESSRHRVRGRARSRGLWLLVTSARVVVWPPRARWCVLACAPCGREGGHRSGSTRSTCTRVYGSWRAAYGPAIVAWCLSLGPVCGRLRGMAGEGSRPGPGAWVAAGGQDGGDASLVRDPLVAAGRRGRAAWWSAP